MPSLQEAHTLFLYFLQEDHTDVSSVSEHERQSLEAVFMSESSALPWDDSELEEVRFLVFFRLPVVVPPTKPMVVPERLRGLTGSCPPCPELGLGPVSGTNSGVSLLPPEKSWIQPLPQLMGSRHESSWCRDGQVNHWESDPTFPVENWVENMPPERVPMSR